MEKDDSSGQTYFITEDRWHPYPEVYEILSKTTRRNPPTLGVPKCWAKVLVSLVHLAGIATGSWHFFWGPKTVDAVTTHGAYSIEKARNELGYSPGYSLEEGQREAVQWYKRNGMVQ